MSEIDNFKNFYKLMDKRALNDILNNLSILYKKEMICPNKEDIFKAFYLCPYDKLRTVIIGQDPYPQRNVAIGILFANKQEVKENNLSPSLKIIKESVLNFEKIKEGYIFENDLQNWAKQGLLLINSALTVKMNEPSSHFLLWYDFMKKFIHNLSIEKPNLSYILFGNQAKVLKSYIVNSKEIREDIHPASYARNKQHLGTEWLQVIERSGDGDKFEWYEKQENKECHS